MIRLFNLSLALLKSAQIRDLERPVTRGRPWGRRAGPCILTLAIALIGPWLAPQTGLGQGERQPSYRDTSRLNQVEAIAFSRSGSLLAYARGSRIGVVDLAMPTSRPFFLTSSSNVSAIVFAAKESLLLTGNNGGKAFVWDLSRKRSVKELHVGDSVMSVDVSPDGRLFAIGCRSGRVLMGDTDSWSFHDLTPRHIYGTRSVRFTPDGRKLLSAGQDQTAHVYYTSNRAFAGYLVAGVMGIKAHMGMLNAVVGLEGGNYALTGAWCDGAAFIEDPPPQDATLRLWNLADLSPVKSMRFPYGVTRICAPLKRSRSKVYLLIGAAPFDYAYKGWGEIRSLDLNLWNSAKVFSDPNYPRSAITAVACSPDGLTLAAGTADGRIYIFDPETGKRLRRPIDDSARSSPRGGE